MGIHIKEINVQDLGPLKRFSMQLGRMNLIYGRNERGKTYLVEFLIRSLFRKADLWRLRDAKGVGKVTVDGLTESGLIKFSPGSARKLEDFWEDANSGLPTDFSRLLVVKGAELELANVDGGADKAILKRLLSNREVLERIEKRISKTIRESSINGGTISGPKRGEISARLNLYEQYTRVTRLFEQLEGGLSGGRRKTFLQESEKLKAEINEQIKAKQFLACTVDQGITKLREKRNQSVIDKVQTAKNKINLYRQKGAEYKKKQEDQKAAADRSRHYEWLKSAHTIYQESLNKGAPPPKPLLGVLTVICLLASGVLVVMSYTMYGLAALAGVLVLGGSYIRQYQKVARTAPETRELEKLREEFSQRFGTKLGGLPDLVELQQNMEEDYNNARLLNKQLSEDLKELYALRLEISELLFDIAGQELEPKFWNEAIRDAEKEFAKVESQIREQELFLAKLGVDPSDFQTERPRVEYSHLKLESLENTLKSIEKKIEDEVRELTSLKQNACEITYDDISVAWEDLLNNLRIKRDELLVEYKQKTSEIIGKLAVFKVISDLREAEDSKVMVNLRSREVMQPLRDMTNRYESLSLEKDRLVVSDPYNNFYLNEISTGAQEQVLLALRVGFTHKLLGKENLFLVLDDAFQYSDWERRKFLVNKVAELAEEGWQIIYITMDDHIRDLFNERGAAFGDDYRFEELQELSG